MSHDKNLLANGSVAELGARSVVELVGQNLKRIEVSIWSIVMLVAPLIITYFFQLLGDALLDRLRNLRVAGCVADLASLVVAASVVNAWIQLVMKIKNVVRVTCLSGSLCSTLEGALSWTTPGTEESLA